MIHILLFKSLLRVLIGVYLVYRKQPKKGQLERSLVIHGKRLSLRLTEGGITQLICSTMYFIGWHDVVIE